MDLLREIQSRQQRKREGCGFSPQGGVSKKACSVVSAASAAPDTFLELEFDDSDSKQKVLTRKIFHGRTPRNDGTSQRSQDEKMPSIFAAIPCRGDMETIYAEKISGKALPLSASKAQLDRANPVKSKESPATQRSLRLSRRKLKELGLFHVTYENVGASYDDMMPLNALWSQYISDILADELPPACRAARLVHADFHGCPLRVEKSVCGSLVGQEGIVVQETEQTFRIISRDDRIRTIPKKPSTFSFDFKGDRYLLFGQNLCYRTAMRTKIKLKGRPTIRLGG